MSMPKASTGATPLHNAAAENHKPVAEVLLVNGADVNAADNNGNTPWRYADGNGFSELRKLFPRARRSRSSYRQQSGDDGDDQ